MKLNWNNDGKLLFRKGKEGDRPPSMYVGIPTCVLICEDTQIGSAIMIQNNVHFIEIFEPHRRKGYGTFFIRRIEEEVKRQGFDFITAYPVLDEGIWVKWDYRIERVEKDGNMLLKKNLS